MRDVARQLRTDFGLVPDIVDEYVVDTPRGEALKATRQVCGVTHYLSLMATGEPQMRKAALFGATITCIDEVTDELGEDLHPDAINAALDGDPPYECLEIIPVAAEEAESEYFADTIRNLCEAQDRSRKQLQPISQEEVAEITQLKGGLSAHANLMMVKDDITPEERDFMWGWGYTMQLLDDYLDQPKDKKAGLSTCFTTGRYDAQDLLASIKQTETVARGIWGDSAAADRFFRVCRLHRLLGHVENRTPASASWFAPGYL